MARPSQLVLVVVVYVTGVLLAMWRGPGSITGPLVGLALLLPTAVAVHWANEASDAGTDALTVRTRFSGGSGALARSNIEPRWLLRGSLLVAAGVATLAVALAVTARVPVASSILLVVGVAGGVAYSVAPVALMRRGVGEPFNAILGALVLPLFGVATVTGRVEALDVLAFLPFTLVTFCSVMATAWPDRLADGSTGKLTLQVRLEPSRLRAIHTASAVAWAVAVVVATWAGAMPFGLTLFAVLPFVLLGWKGYTRRAAAWPSVAAMVGHILVMSMTLLVALP